MCVVCCVLCVVVVWKVGCDDDEKKRKKNGRKTSEEQNIIYLYSEVPTRTTFLDKCLSAWDITPCCELVFHTCRCSQHLTKADSAPFVSLGRKHMQQHVAHLHRFGSKPAERPKVRQSMSQIQLFPNWHTRTASSWCASHRTTNL